MTSAYVYPCGHRMRAHPASSGAIKQPFPTPPAIISNPRLSPSFFPHMCPAVILNTCHLWTPRPAGLAHALPSSDTPAQSPPSCHPPYRPPKHCRESIPVCCDTGSLESDMWGVRLPYSFVRGSTSYFRSDCALTKLTDRPAERGNASLPGPHKNHYHLTGTL